MLTTYSCGHFAIYANIESLCCTPDGSIVSYISYISIKNGKLILKYSLS